MFMVFTASTYVDSCITCIYGAYPNINGIAYKHKYIIPGTFETPKFSSKNIPNHF